MPLVYFILFMLNFHLWYTTGNYLYIFCTAVWGFLFVFRSLDNGGL